LDGARREGRRRKRRRRALRLGAGAALAVAATVGAAVAAPALAPPGGSGSAPAAPVTEGRPSPDVTFQPGGTTWAELPRPPLAAGVTPAVNNPQVVGSAPLLLHFDVNPAAFGEPVTEVQWSSL